jgi:GTP-binding protein
LCLGFFSHQFSSRARTRVATAQARLSEVSFTEESGLVLTDTGNQTLEGDNSKAVKKLPGSNIVISGPDLGRTAQVKEAEFIKSSSKETECPTEGFPEIALVGRSNVGKSSLINAMVQRKELAQTSKKPGACLSFCLSSPLLSTVSPIMAMSLTWYHLAGKTQLINHFLINKKWYLVDLPGYG